LPIAKQGIRHPIISSMTLVSWNPSSRPMALGIHELA
jgi:hypothetical protein